MSVLALDRLSMSRLRITAGDPLFFEWKDLGRDPIQLSLITLYSLHPFIGFCSQGREADSGPHEQYSLLGPIFGIYGLVASEEPCWSLVGN